MRHRDRAVPGRRVGLEVGEELRWEREVREGVLDRALIEERRLRGGQEEVELQGESQEG